MIRPPTISTPTDTLFPYTTLFRSKIDFVGVKGCDVAPVDLTDPAQALRLKAYIWPEHHVRFGRIEAAIAAAEADPPDLVRMSAADFVEAELAKPQAAGTTRVLMHSIVWQYVPADQQARITAAMEAVGARAKPDSSEKRREGKEGIGTCRSGGTPI